MQKWLLFFLIGALLFLASLTLVITNSYFYLPDWVSGYYQNIVLYLGLSVLLTGFGLWLKKPQNSLNFSKLLVGLFGSWKWNYPEWFLAFSERGVFRSIKHYLLSFRVWVLFSLFTMCFGGTLFLHYLSNKPKVSDKVSSVNKEIRVTVDAPYATSFEKGSQGEIKSVVYPLNIHFSDSAADLKDRSKEIESPPRIIPFIEGKWSWQEQNTIVFVPREDWPVGENFRVIFSKNLFADNAIIKQSEVKFQTNVFEGEVQEQEFYEDPVDPLNKKVVSTFRFTHPVEKEDLVKNVSVNLFKKVAEAWSFQNKINFQVIKTSIGQKYTVHSDKIALTSYPQKIVIEVNSSLSSRFANKALKSMVQSEVIIPSIKQFYYFKQPAVKLIENTEGTQEQILSIISSTAIKEAELQKNIQVYQLPKNTGNGRWHNTLDIPKSVFNASNLLPIVALPREREYAKEHFFKLKVNQGSQVFVRLKEGLPSFQGYKLTNDFDFILSVPKYRSTAKLIPSGNILKLQGSGKISILIRNIKKVELEVSQVLNNQIHHYLGQNQGDMQSPQFSRNQFNESHFTRTVKKEIFVPKTEDPNIAYFHVTNLKKMLRTNFADAKGRGFFIIKIKNAQSGVVTDSRLVMLSDFAIIAKKQADESYQVYVYDISTTGPAKNVEVEVIGNNGLALFRRKTDSNGSVNFPDLRPSYDDPKPLAFVARHGNNISFMKVNAYNRRVYYSSNELGGVWERGDISRKLKAYVFSDRKIYRPGEEGWFGSVIKDNKWSKVEVGQPIIFKIFDPKNKLVTERRSKVLKYGLNEFQHKFTKSDPTGSYNVRIYSLGGSNKKEVALGSTSVRVEEFLPDRIKINANFKSKEANKKKAWIHPNDVQVSTTLRNLFGTPVTKSKITLESDIYPTGLYFSAFPDFQFSHFNQIESNVSLGKYDASTDDKGELEYKIDLDKWEGNTFKLFVNVEGFEKEGGRSVRTKLSQIVSNHKFLIGVKTQDMSFVKKGERKTIDLLGVNQFLIPFSPQNLRRELVQVSSVRTLVKRPNGTFRYEVLKKENILEITPLELNKGKASFEVDSSRVGEFYYRIIDVENSVYAKIYYEINGVKKLSFNEREAKLKLKLSKKDYAPGETIEIEVQSPYTGAGLVTIERDKVYTSKWFKMNSTQKILKIQIPKTLEGNAYVNVAIMRSTDSPEVNISPLSVEVANFSINKDKRKVVVTLDHESLVKPNDRLKIKFKTNHKTKLILFGVDEGILQVAKYKTPDLINFFLSKKALSVDSYQTLDMVLADQGVAQKVAAGGGAGQAFGSTLNPFARKVSDPVVFWSGILNSHSKFQEHEFKIPDYFNGKMRIIAVAVNEDRVGVNKSFVTVRGDIIIMPNTPTFVAPKDKFEVSVILANNVEGDKPVKISLEAITSKHLKVLGTKTMEQTIGPLKDTVYRFEIEATEELGPAEITFIAKHPDVKGEAKLKSTLSVRPPSHYQFSIWSGAIGKNTGSSKEVINFTRKIAPHLAFEHGVLSQNPLLALESAGEFLNKYPYGCSEQIISKAISAITFGFTKGSKVNKNFLLDFHRDVMKMLNVRLTSDGLSLYPGSNIRPNFVSLYALFYLHLANQKNLLHVPVKIVNLLKRRVKSVYLGDSSYFQKAFSIYLLAIFNEPVGMYLSQLNRELDTDTQNKMLSKYDLGHLLMAATYKHIGNEKKALERLSFFKLKQEDFKPRSVYYSESFHNAFGVYLLSEHFTEKSKIIEEGNIKSLFTAIGNNNNSLTVAMSVLAAEKYFDNVKLAPLKNLEVVLDKEVESEIISKNIDWNGVAPLQVQLGDSSRKLMLGNSNEKPFYFSITRAGFDTEGLEKDLVSGLQISKNLFNESRSPVTRVKQGEEVLVEIAIQSKDGKKHENVVVVDLIPGGFEPILNQDSSQGSSLQEVDYFDRREDRMIFYLEAGQNTKVIKYRMKAVNKGSYILPGSFAEDLYNSKVRARSESKRIEVDM